MLIAIFGSQGSGKTTVINELHKRGFPIVERKTSRSILSDWDVTLQEVNNNGNLTTRFQDEIILRKMADEKEFAADTSTVYFTERTFADLFTYSLIALGKDNQYGDWLNSYYEKCREANQIYLKAFYLKAGFFTVEHDGVRGSNMHYSRMVDLVLQDTSKQMFMPNKIDVVDTSNLEQRIKIVTEL